MNKRTEYFRIALTMLGAARLDQDDATIQLLARDIEAVADELPPMDQSRRQWTAAVKLEDRIGGIDKLKGYVDTLRAGKAKMTSRDLCRLPPAVRNTEGQLKGLIYIGAGNVYAALEDTHGDNFLISAGIKMAGTVDLDIEGMEWVEVQTIQPHEELV